jgi:hypothetical protein
MLFVEGLRFSQQCCLSANFIRVKRSKKTFLGLLDSGDDGTTVLRNVGSVLQIDKALISINTSPIIYKSA